MMMIFERIGYVPNYVFIENSMSHIARIFKGTVEMQMQKMKQIEQD